MKILCVSDEESPYFWEHYQPGRLKDIDLILSCGDLKAEYLEFLVTMGRAPVLYVPGNHDGRYETRPPEGCDCIDGKLVTVGGIRILGLGGCQRYNNGTQQYTEREMRRRLFKLRWRLERKGVDIVLTHSAPEDCGDAPDPAHRGFAVFRELMDTYKPAFLIHGHVHKSYGKDYEREICCGDTTVINACGYYILEWPPKT